MHGRLDSNGLIIEYPVDNLRARYPNVSLPADLTIGSNLPSGYVYVHESPQPIGTWDQNVLEGNPAQVGDMWVQTWEVQSASEYEQAQRTDNKAVEVRNIRNNKLTQSDWTQLSDSPADKVSWATYRQALRDISGQPGFPWDVAWPVEP
jgi:hypothetical protein